MPVLLFQDTTLHLVCWLLKRGMAQNSKEKKKVALSYTNLPRCPLRKQPLTSILYPSKYPYLSIYIHTLPTLGFLGFLVFTVMVAHCITCECPFFFSHLKLWFENLTLFKHQDLHSFFQWLHGIHCLLSYKPWSSQMILTGLRIFILNYYPVTPYLVPPSCKKPPTPISPASEVYPQSSSSVWSNQIFHFLSKECPKEPFWEVVFWDCTITSLSMTRVARIFYYISICPL